VLLQFEDRASDSPFVERVWRSRSVSAGLFHSMAEPNLELVFARVGGAAQAVLRGPVTRASLAPCPADGEWLAMRFRLGTYLPAPPVSALLDHNSVFLPCRRDGQFWLAGRWWTPPSYESAETFVAHLAAAGLIARDDLVGAVVAGGEADAGLRSVQRRFLRFTGLTRSGFRQIERARQAAGLLRDGVDVLDVVDAAGYFDQPHLHRAMRRLVGQTPRDLARGQAQLSFLSKTRLAAGA
jgi:hypothetical protein